MATKESFVLTLSPKYIPTWGKWEAFREIMQNSIDRQTEMPSAEIIFSYDAMKQRMRIGNKMSILDRSTLVLGETHKASDDTTIGKYGEGYKLALLVLLRMGIRVRIRTGNEIWAPEIKFSEQFQTELLTITAIEAKQSDNLIFELDGITEDDYKEFQRNCLLINAPTNKIHTPLGDVLLDEQFKAKIFVGGLYVCTFTDEDRIRYGYNMIPGCIDLDRDRRKVAQFNLLWEVSRMYSYLDSTYASLIYELQKEKWRDIEYYNQHVSNRNNPLYQSLCSMHYNDFVVQHGKFAIPVQNQAEADFIKEKYNGITPIVVNAVEYRYITESPAYATSTKSGIVKEDTPHSLTKAFIRKHLVGAKFSEARDVLSQEFLPLTRNWKIRTA